VQGIVLTPQTEAIAIGGDVAAGFEKVRDAFMQCAPDAGDGGFAYAAYHEGRKVVDLWTGMAGAEPWRDDTTPLWMSVTKAFTALCVEMLAERGLLDVDAPIADYWPDFAVAGKGAITTADVMTHRSGVIGAREATDLISLDDGAGLDRSEDIAGILAACRPFWAPGSQTGYHTLTYGWLLGELIRRIDGRDLGTFFREEVALPLGVDDVSIGAPADRHERIATILPTMWPDAMPPLVRDYLENVLALARDPETPAGLSCLARDGVGALDRIPEIFNHAPARTTPLGGSNLVGTAGGVARVFAALATPGGIEGVELVSPHSVDMFTTVRNTDVDVVLQIPINRALGYWRNLAVAGRPQSFGPHEEAFGHTGVGGQLGFADPKAHIGAAYVRSHHTAFGFAPLLLNGALYESVDAL
jgi:CubicO group peptidase (beta-lactamase class C family)